MSREQQRNLRDAKNYFGIDVSIPINERYNVKRIDSEMFNLGMIDGSNKNIVSIPDEKKDNHSYIWGFERARRILKAQTDSYELGKKYSTSGCLLEDIPDNYRNNEYFMQGYNELINDKLRDNTIKHSGR
jgi:hypothetical protein